MSNFATARRTMVDNQIRTTDVTDARVLAAFGAVPRELFVPEALRGLAYIDESHRLAASGTPRWLMAPSPFAKLVQLAAIASTDKVLIVGSGSGYSVAVVALLAASVIGLEENAELVASSSAAIIAAGGTQARILSGTLTEGAAAAGPFDVILIEGSVSQLPASLSAQLAEGGRLVVVEGSGNSATARIYLKTGEALAGRSVFNLSAKPLPGFERKPEFSF